MTVAGDVRLRFAPSPTGSLHLGNARTALFNWLIARQTGGAFILRIEDTDTAREQEGSLQSILDDLRWLGLGWDEGPEAGGGFGPYLQSQRMPAYVAAAQTLLDAGSAYRCFCADQDLEARRAAQRAAGLPPRYDGRCRKLPAEESARKAEAGATHALRFAVPSQTDGRSSAGFDDRLRGRVEFPLAELGDPVLMRGDGRPTYNFAVVVDDAAMRITLVVRGDDHLSNTPRQVLLYRALGHAVPEFAHLPMVRGPDGDRLSKRHGATSVAECRARGYPPDAVINALALLGWSPGGDRTIVTPDELLAEFELDRVSRSPGTFDPAKLDWISAQHIQRMPEAVLAAEAAARLIDAGRLPADAPQRARSWLEELARMLRSSLERFDQVVARCESVFATGGAPESAEAAEVLAADGARDVIEHFGAHLAEQPPEDRETWRHIVADVRAQTGRKGKALFLPIRVALTGSAAGPELDHVVPLVAAGARLFPGSIPTLEERTRRTLEALR